MSKRQQKSSFSNSFAALALHEEQDPKQVLRKQSSRQQKKLEYQAQKALSSPQTTRQQHQQQQQASSSKQRTGNSSSTADNDALGRQSSGPDSPGLKAALRAIAEADAMHSLAPMPESVWPDSCYDAAASAAPAGLADSDAEDSAWANVQQSSSSDPWSTPSHLSQQQQQQIQPAASPSPQSPSNPSAPPCSHAAPSSAEAYGWRDFALRFAEAARQAGDDDAAVGALLFGASESLSSAALAADDSAAAVQLAGVAEQAAAAGLTIQELLQAQQQELLLQIDKAQQKGQIGRSNQRSSRGSTWQQMPAHLWADTASSGSSSRGTSPSPAAAMRAQLPDVDDASAFPQLQASPNAGGWQQAGPSPHAVSKHWKGGRLAPKPKGVKVLNTPSSSSNSRPDQPGFRVSKLDLHWDLCMDGLSPLQRPGDGNSSCSYDGATPPGFGGVGGVGTRGVQLGGGVGGLHGDEEAVQRTRELLADQAAAAAAAAAAGGGQRGDSGRDGLDQDTLRSMMDGASKRSRQAPGSSTPPPAAAAADGGGPSSPCAGGSKGAFGYSWGAIFKNACAAGWQPVSSRDGGGGSHFKLRRVLPKSGTTQTMVLASTPSDTQRGVRNTAAAFKRKDEEMERLEAQAAAEQQAALTAGQARGERKQ